MCEVSEKSNDWIPRKSVAYDGQKKLPFDPPYELPLPILRAKFEIPKIEVFLFWSLDQLVVEILGVAVVRTYVCTYVRTYVRHAFSQKLLITFL